MEFTSLSEDMNIDPTKVKPMGKRILVKQNQKQEKTDSGLILKQYAMKEGAYKQTFTVINVGSKVTAVKPGDIVSVDWEKQIFGSGGSKAVRLVQSEEQYFFFDEDSVVGVWDEMPKFD